MTAQIIELVPVGGRADDTIRRTIKALTKGKGMSPESVAEESGISRSTYFAKMAGKGTRNAFKAGEVASIALALGVSVGQLYDGLGGTFVPPDGPEGTNVGAERARRYSKPQPSDPKVLPLLAVA